MPYEITIDVAARRVTILATGAADLATTIEAIEGVAADPCYRPGFDHVVDARTLDYVPTFTDVLAIRDVFQRVSRSYRGPMAVVVGGTVLFGVSQSVASMIDLFGVRLHTFRELPAAIAWLDKESHKAGV
jgi:hypothetical protein